MSKKIAVYPGSFDPITKGHLDIIKRASGIFDTVYVAILTNSAKTPMFSVDERKDFIKRSTEGIENVVVESFSGLLVDFAKKVNATVIVKGLRAMSDFEYEFQMALMNRKLDKSIETMFLTTSGKYSYLSSSIVKEVARHSASLDGLVPDCIINDIIKKANSKN
ncbi:MAG: pantetheine-phosphate adenylyltransferase [Ruminococcaceae bacterium]|nr:pantetheine-phosphate adenylyltransferase [Oscillospiraceae bacterium]